LKKKTEGDQKLIRSQEPEPDDKGAGHGNKSIIGFRKGLNPKKGASR